MMAELPAYANHAFGAIEVLRVDDEEQQDFVRRWGGLNLAVFVRALQEGDRHDQQVSAFAIGYSESTWARDLLLPVLHSEYPEVRWAAALMLGHQREETAFQTLIEMLQEFLPPHTSADYNYDWYDVKHIHIARLLGSWGKREAIQPLHDTLARLWQTEQQRSSYEDVQMWSHYQDAMVYALGQLEAFDTLDDLDISAERKRFWMVTLVMGYLNAEHLYKKSILQIVQDGRLNTNLAEFLRLVSDQLQEKMGMSFEETEVAIKSYDSHYFDRWEQQE